MLRHQDIVQGRSKTLRTYPLKGCTRLPMVGCWPGPLYGYVMSNRDTVKLQYWCHTSTSLLFMVSNSAGRLCRNQGKANQGRTANVEWKKRPWRKPMPTISDWWPGTIDMPCFVMEDIAETNINHWPVKLHWTSKGKLRKTTWRIQIHQTSPRYVLVHRVIKKM